MPYSKINKTGCCERHGNMQIRIDYFLEPDDVRYSDRYVQVHVFPDGGYPGEVDKEGMPKSQKEYDVWEASLPHIWQLTPFHSHFFYASPEITDAEIKAEMDFHLPNFYAAFQNEWDKVQGGMRHGWDVEKRIRPVRYSKTLEAQEYLIKKQLVEDRLSLITGIESKSSSLDGKEYPSTDIDVGADAIVYDSYADLVQYTWLAVDNPANDTGSIDTVDTILTVSATNLRVGTFDTYGGDIYECRDAQEIGSMDTGYRQTTGLDISIVIGDLIGADADGIIGRISHYGIGYGGCQRAYGQYVYVGSSCPYTLRTGDAMALYGTGETAGGGGWNHNINGVTNSVSITNIPAANIASINGVLA
jgi:hypothetical protein